MAEAPSDNYFGTFLETVQSKESETRANVAPMSLLVVMEEHGAMEAKKLQAAVQLDLLSFSKALETLREANLVTLSGPAGKETVGLTEEGHRLAELQLAMS